MDEIHKPGGGVPVRLTLLIFFSIVLKHLFGGSAGKEGTAVQMGGSVATLFSKWYKLKHRYKRILLMCGMAAGSGAVFGTPVAGAVFVLEVLAIWQDKVRCFKTYRELIARKTAIYKEAEFFPLC